MNRASIQHENLFATVGKRFRPDQMLGSEGAFIVQHAVDIRGGHEAALKRPKDRTSQRQLLSLHIEAEALSRLRHPGIPKLLGCALDSDDPYLAMEFVQGARYNINNILDDRIACVVRLSIAACYVLTEAHRLGIIHRDICPANLVMSNDRNRLSIIDFGVAFVPGLPDLAADRLVGRPDFMSPEQAVVGKRVGPGADVFSVGSIAYMYLSGHSPYVAQQPDDESVLHAHRSKEPVHIRSVADWLPKKLSEAIMRSVARNPEARFSGAAEFGEALARCL